jgi:hypothetical protein
MTVATLHLLHEEPSVDFGVLRLASLPGDDGARLIVWDGLAPPPVPESPLVAPTALAGDVEGSSVYAERVPKGLRLSDTSLPPALAPLVATRILEAVAHLHRHGFAHGLIAPDRVMLGTDGQIALFGRGRRSGSFDGDVLQAQALVAGLGLPHPGTEIIEDLIDAMTAAVAPEDREALSAHVAAALPRESTPLRLLTLQVGPTRDSLDEVLPDLGTDPSDARGLLDPYDPLNTTGDLEHTAELTSGAGEDRGGPSAAVSLWTRLAARNEHPPPPDRFRDLSGRPSVAARALILEESPDAVPAWIGGVVGPFLLEERNDSSGDGAWPTGATDPESTPGPRDGDTAVSHLRQGAPPIPVQAQRRAEFADLQRKLADAERRAAEAERRAALETATWGGFLRVEIAIALILGALAAWLLLRWLT